MSKRKWTYEKVLAEAKKYQTRAIFIKNNRVAYNAAHRFGWLNKVTSHMPYEGGITWTKEMVQKEADKYQTRTVFRKENRKAYRAAYHFGWIDEMYPLVGKPYKPANYWTKERLIKTAKKFNTRNDFRKKYRGGHEAARKNGWLDEIFAHIPPKWSKHKVANIALKYKYRSEFREHDINAYSAASKHGWLNEVCSHMDYKCSNIKRYVYVFEFNDYNTAYIGLTYNLDNREARHNSDIRSPIHKFLKKHNLSKKDYYIKVIGHYKSQNAGDVEQKTIVEYETNGWITLNTHKGGSLGGNVLKWNKEKVMESAKKYKTKSDFCLHNRGAYASAKKYGWFDEATKHMIPTRKLMLGHGQKWTLEKVRKAAKKYNHKYDFQLNSSNEYQAARRNGWFEEVTKHMTRPINHNFKWTKQRVHKEALKYNTKQDLLKSDSKLYSVARKRGWFDDVTSHMITKKEIIQKEALKYKSRGEFCKGNGNAYRTAWRNGWLSEIFD